MLKYSNDLDSNIAWNNINQAYMELSTQAHNFLNEVTDKTAFNTIIYRFKTISKEFILFFKYIIMNDYFYEHNFRVSRNKIFNSFVATYIYPKEKFREIIFKQYLCMIKNTKHQSIFTEYLHPKYVIMDTYEPYSCNILNIILMLSGCQKDYCKLGTEYTEYINNIYERKIINNIIEKIKNQNNYYYSEFNVDLEIIKNYENNFLLDKCYEKEIKTPSNEVFLIPDDVLNIL
jgi:hypothetical protein